MENPVFLDGKSWKIRCFLVENGRFGEGVWCFFLGKMWKNGLSPVF